LGFWSSGGIGFLFLWCPGIGGIRSCFPSAVSVQPSYAGQNEEKRKHSGLPFPRTNTPGKPFLPKGLPLVGLTAGKNWCGFLFFPKWYQSGLALWKPWKPDPNYS
jgi:hypothetical protein